MSTADTTDVAIFVPGLASGGGAEKTALVTAAAFVAAGLSVTCYTDADVSITTLGGHFAVDLGGVSFHVLPSPRLPASTPRALRDLVRDLAHARVMRAGSPRLFINMKFKSELPGIGRHNWYYTYFPHRLQVAKRSRAHAAYLHLVTTLRRKLLLGGRIGFLDSYDLVLACSEFTRTHVRARWGVDATTLHPPCSQLSGAALHNRTRTILNVGRFQADGPNIPHKRQDVLVETFAGMPDLVADGWTLHLVGAVGTRPADLAYLDHVRDLAEGLPVSVHANAPHELLTELSAHARIYWHAQGYGTDGSLHPEAQEHFGISTVEAMAAGMVPVVYATAGPAEVVQEEPELMWRKPDELASQTSSLLEPERWSQWHLWCRRRAADFSTKAFAARLTEHYVNRIGPLPLQARDGS